ncbi:MAG: hypothetical protein ACSNEK_07445 [Parachlamydiaceae bacterium]
MSVNPSYSNLIKTIKIATENYHSQKEFFTKLKVTDESIQKVAQPEFKHQYQESKTNLQSADRELRQRIKELENYYKEHTFRGFIDFFKYLFTTSPLTRARKELDHALTFNQQQEAEQLGEEIVADKLEEEPPESLAQLKNEVRGEVDGRMTSHKNIDALLNFLERPSEEGARNEILNTYNGATPNEQAAIFSNIEALKEAYLDNRLEGINLFSYAREIKLDPTLFLELLPQKEI